MWKLGCQREVLIHNARSWKPGSRGWPLVFLGREKDKPWAVMRLELSLAVTWSGQPFKGRCNHTVFLLDHPPPPHLRLLLSIQTANPGRFFFPVLSLSLSLSLSLLLFLAFTRLENCCPAAGCHEHNLYSTRVVLMKLPASCMTSGLQPLVAPALHW